MLTLPPSSRNPPTVCDAVEPNWEASPPVERISIGMYQIVCIGQFDIGVAAMPGQPLQRGQWRVSAEPRKQLIIGPRVVALWPCGFHENVMHPARGRPCTAVRLSGDRAQAIFSRPSKEHSRRICR